MIVRIFFKILEGDILIEQLALWCLSLLVCIPVCLQSWFAHGRYPPGHGDVFPSLMNSGKLDTLLSQVGITVQFLITWLTFSPRYWHSFFLSLVIFYDRVRSMCLLPTQITWVLLLTWVSSFGSNRSQPVGFRCYMCLHFVWNRCMNKFFQHLLSLTCCYRNLKSFDPKQEWVLYGGKRRILWSSFASLASQFSLNFSRDYAGDTQNLSWCEGWYAHFLWRKSSGI